MKSYWSLLKQITKQSYKKDFNESNKPLDWSLLNQFTLEEQKQILKAAKFACMAHFEQRRKSIINCFDPKVDIPEFHEPYFLHPLEVAHICLESKGDATEIISALLHDVVEDTNVTLDEIEENFGSEVRRIVDGVTKIPKVYGSKTFNLEEATLRKVIISTISDIRIIRIKLADRLHNMRTLDSMSPKKQKQKSEETLDTFVPVAKHIGAYKIARELEDLAFPYLYLKDYREFKEKWDLMKETYSQNLEDLYNSFTRELMAHDYVQQIRIQYSNLYSFFWRLNGKKDGIDELVTIKVIVNNIEDCYRTLGLINTKFNVNSVLKDYIGCPEDNGYQSLHTTLYNPMQDNPHSVLVKIRTQEMDDLAAYGITSAMYSKNKKYASELAKVFGSIDAISGSNRDFLNQLKQDLTSAKIHVFTPTGEMYTVNDGYTIVDFAYKLHTDFGNHINGAYIGNRFVPKEQLIQKLHDGDEVKIVKSNDSEPIPGWINRVQSSNARDKIRLYYNKKLKD